MSVGTLSNPVPLPFHRFPSPSPGTAPLTFFPQHRAARRREPRRFTRSLELGTLAPSHRLRRAICFLSQSSDSLDLPLLPFQPDEVLVRSECKTLHLYEARYLALLEESLGKREKHFVHFVLDPVPTGKSSAGTSFVAKYGCLVFIEHLDIGALVSIRGIGRVSIMNLVQTEPYLRGVVIPLQDKIQVNGSEINSKVAALKESLYSLNSLEIKLKADKDELLQTRSKNSLIWAEKEASIDLNQAFIPRTAERISFAALQPVSGSMNSELLALQRRKLWAMTSTDTSERLDSGLGLVKHNIALVAAKLAIQSVEM